MREKKSDESDFVACLRNFCPQIAQFYIKTGAYETVLLDYFKVCPYVQNLEINWSEISRDLSKPPPKRTIPQWVCSKYHKCEHNEHCHPPFHRVGVGSEYYCISDRDYTVFADGGERKFNIDKFLTECNEKVLFSPSRFNQAREKYNYSLDQIANMCGLTKQALSASNMIRENPTHKLNCIATKNCMVTQKYPLCCLLAVLCEVTPGYLMGQTDNPDCDIYIRKNAYYKIETVYQNGAEATIKNTSPVHEEYEVCGELCNPIKFFSQKKREGRMAADRIRGYSDQLSHNFQQLIELCEKIYYRPIPPKLQKDLRLIFEGLLDSTNTANDGW